MIILTSIEHIIYFAKKNVLIRFKRSVKMPGGSKQKIISAAEESKWRRVNIFRKFQLIFDMDRLKFNQVYLRRIYKRMLTTWF